MNNPWKIWLVFGLCLAVLLAAMGWVSRTTLRLDRTQAESANLAELEENVRLALWRIESALTPLIAEEGARPYSTFFSFHAAEQAYTRSGVGVDRREMVTPSPLLSLNSSNVLLHFQFWPDGTLSSPQVPTAAERNIAEPIYTTRQQIETAAARLSRLQEVLNAPAQSNALASLSIPDKSGATPLLPPTPRNRDILINQCAFIRTNTVDQAFIPAPTPFNLSRQTPIGQQLMNSAEHNARANNYQQVLQQALLNNGLLTANIRLSAAAEPGPLKALWLGDALFLARRVNLEGRFVVQGCWLNWTNLKQLLLANVKDLFPAADLQPVLNSNSGRQARLLAALPLRLVPGLMNATPTPRVNAVRISMAIAWVCVLLAALAVAILLHGAVSLSQRRGAFVSAVTHELRTPLTTFKMYSEMLAEGMVPDETKRKHYLNTLCSEANRLSHLVENVLAFARLERGSARTRVEKLGLGQLLERVKPRLVQRTEQDGMRLLEDTTEDALKTVVHVDVGAVEQILFNLVDNACKYARSPGGENLIHIEALTRGKYALLRVRDHGQGISVEGAKRLFRPFNKSATEAARTAPGVGLGLALCRRLSRSLGGELSWVATIKNGSCFELKLPIGPREKDAML